MYDIVYVCGGAGGRSPHGVTPKGGRGLGGFFGWSWWGLGVVLVGMGGKEPRTAQSDELIYYMMYTYCMFRKGGVCFVRTSGFVANIAKRLFYPAGFQIIYNTIGSHVPRQINN